MSDFSYKIRVFIFFGVSQLTDSAIKDYDKINTMDKDQYYVIIY